MQGGRQAYGAHATIWNEHGTLNVLYMVHTVVEESIEAVARDPPADSGDRHGVLRTEAERRNSARQCANWEIQSVPSTSTEYSPKFSLLLFTVTEVLRCLGTAILLWAWYAVVYPYSCCVCVCVRIL